MAAANAQVLQNALDNTNLAANQPLDKFIDGKPLIDWNSNGRIRLDAILAAVKAGALDGLTVANGTAAGGPNAGGGAPAAGVAAAYNTASILIYGKPYGMVEKGTSLHIALGQSPCVSNAYFTYSLINHSMQSIHAIIHSINHSFIHSFNQIQPNYPATLFPGGPAHPNAGNPISNAGQRDIEIYTTLLQTRFTNLFGGTYYFTQRSG